MSRYNLAFCELFHPAIHGITNYSYKNISEHFLVIEIIDIEEYFNDEICSSLLNDYYIYLSYRVISPHPTVRNYHRLANNCAIEIVEDIELETGELIGIIKTFWIKLIQRKWKKIFKNRKEIISQRKRITNLRERELTGRFPGKLNYYH